jgi:hypothetical protein
MFSCTSGGSFVNRVAIYAANFRCSFGCVFIKNKLHKKKLTRGQAEDADAHDRLDHVEHLAAHGGGPPPLPASYFPDDDIGAGRRRAARWIIRLPVRTDAVMLIPPARVERQRRGGGGYGPTASVGDVRGGGREDDEDT